MKITKEQFNEYLQENWDEHFFQALAKCVKEELFPVLNKEKEDDYKQQLKDLIFEAIRYGTKEYLEEYEGEVFQIMGEQFFERLKYATFSLK